MWGSAFSVVFLLYNEQPQPAETQASSIKQPVSLPGERLPLLPEPVSQPCCPCLMIGTFVLMSPSTETEKMSICLFNPLRSMCGVLTVGLQEEGNVRHCLPSRHMSPKWVPTTQAACEDTKQINTHGPLHNTTQAPPPHYTSDTR